MMKKVILVLIDSLRPQAVQKALKDGYLPALSWLIERGWVSWECASIYPTMTPAASSSIITGLMPSEHHVAGFAWFDRREDRYVNYGGNVDAVLRLGPSQVLNDLFYHLNHTHLTREVPTLFEVLEGAGITCGNINFFMYRGVKKWKLRVPFWANLLTAGKIKRQLKGPTWNFLGNLLSLPADFRVPPGMEAPAGPLTKYGINDEFGGTVAHWLIKSGKQPDFLFLYLPDTDGYCHRHHPDNIVPSLVRADRQVAKILDAYSCWEEALAENLFIVMGDHSQSWVRDDGTGIISLEKLFPGFSIARYRHRRGSGFDLALCSNERSAHVYLLKPDPVLRREVIARAAAEPRIDQITWLEEGEDGRRYYRVKRGGEEGELCFRRGGSLKDVYGNRWEVEGDLSLVDARVEGDTLYYGAYPNPLDNIASYLDDNKAGDVQLAARPTYEFSDEGMPVHPGRGSHGSFHRDDALVPLIIAGVEEEKIPQPLREHPMIIDVAPFILQHFQVECAPCSWGREVRWQRGESCQVRF